MRIKLVLSAVICVAAASVAAWLLHSPSEAVPASASPQVSPVSNLRLGLVPEQDIFRQRKAYRALGDYLQTKLATPIAASGEHTTASGFRVELVTAASYIAILKDFEEKKIDAAFMGSLVAVLAVDRYQAQVVLKSEGENGLNTYCGVIFVLDSSPAQTFPDLRHKRLGAVRTTLGGAVFPVYLMNKLGLTDAAAGGDGPHLVWCGTHDDVIREVVAGNLDAGAVKDLRFLAYQQAHPDVHFRKLAESGRVPDNALLIRRDYPPEQRDALVRTLLAMNQDPQAAPALAALKIKKYLPCVVQDYAVLYELIDELGPGWSDLKIEGSIPKAPADPTTRPASRPPAKGGI